VYGEKFIKMNYWQHTPDDIYKIAVKLQKNKGSPFENTLNFEDRNPCPVMFKDEDNSKTIQQDPPKNNSNSGIISQTYNKFIEERKNLNFVNEKMKQQRDFEMEMEKRLRIVENKQSNIYELMDKMRKMKKQTHETKNLLNNKNEDSDDD
jgi:hypothetical protein